MCHKGKYLSFSIWIYFLLFVIGHSVHFCKAYYSIFQRKMFIVIGQVADYSDDLVGGKR